MSEPSSTDTSLDTPPSEEGLLESLERMDAAERAEHDAAVSASVAPDREFSVAKGETLLAVDGLTVRFGGLTALDDVSFDVRRGEILGLIGPNGAGKTTCFNIMTGVYRPSSGDILLEGQSLARMKRYKIIQTGVARTFQNIRLFGAMTALENVVVGTDARQPQDRAAQARLHAGMLAHHDVLERAHRPEQPDVLERPGHAVGHDQVRALRGDVAPVEQDLARRRLVEAGEHVEEGGLAGPVRPDDRDDRFLGHPERDAVDRGQAAEDLRQIGRLHHRRRGVEAILLGLCLRRAHARTSTIGSDSSVSVNSA